MAGSFKRGKNKKGKTLPLGKPAISQTDKGGVEIDESSVKDLKIYAKEVEHIRHLQRQAKHSGLDLQKNKLEKEQASRDEYNNRVIVGSDSLYSKALPPTGSCVMQLFKKPIFELDGFLKPDLVKKENPKTGSTFYVENRFPYLDCGVVVSENGLTKQFGEIEGDWKGAIVTLKPKVRLDQYVYFIDKTDINPTYFEGHVCIPAYEIESVLAVKGNKHYDAMVQKLLGKVGNAEVQARITAEAAEQEDKKEETNEEG